MCIINGYGFNNTLNNISVISWQSVLFMEKIGISGENHGLMKSRLQKLSHKVISRITRHEVRN